MLNFPHFVVFVPFAVFALSFAVSVTVNAVVTYRTRPRTQTNARPLAARPLAARPLPSAEIIYFNPRKTSVASMFGGFTQAIHR